MADTLADLAAQLERLQTQSSPAKPETLPPLSCGGCPSRWSGLARAHCAGCHLTFTGVSAFDRHRAGGTCTEPSALGMVRRENGIWGAPALSPEEAAEIWKKDGS